MLVGSTWASVLIPGAASVQPCGTDMLPTRAALPMAPDTGAPPTGRAQMRRRPAGQRRQRPADELSGR